MRNEVIPRGLLIIFGGLPGVGKSTVARLVATTTEATYLRVDSLEHALVAAGLCSMDGIGGAGYDALAAIAGDNLRLGRAVVADLVNPFEFTRRAWRELAARIGSIRVEVEVLCSDAAEHRRRVEQRESDIPGLALPDWDAVLRREYEPWQGERLALDTAVLAPDAAAARAVEYVRMRVETQ